MNNKIPLTIYVTWHPEFKKGNLYAKAIYSNFTRDIENPASRGIGIPVLFPSSDKSVEHKIKINFDASERIVIVLLIDKKMLLDNEWYSYTEELQNSCDNNSKYIIYPVAITKTAFSFPVDNIKSKNFIRLFEKRNDKKINYLIFILAHELCRFLYGIERISEVDNTQSPPPIKLFLSHAKSDGVDIAKSIWHYIKLDTPLDDFFDAQDIAPGYDFEMEIKSAIPNCMLLVIHTDNYSSREWCRKEILISKESSIPILVLDCLEKLEKRSFPYMSNVQTLRVKEAQMNYEEIITMSLLEVLRHKYQSIYINFILESYGLNILEHNILSYPPELFSLLQTIGQKESIVIYPDPPLGTDELVLLKRFNTDLKFVTPTLLHCIDSKTKKINERPLKEHNIGISISECREENPFGLNILHLQDIMVEIARYLLVEGAHLSYGGDIRYREDFNFVEILTSLVKNHNLEHTQIAQRITNYVANYLKKFVSDQIQSDLINLVKFKFIKPLRTINYNESDDALYSRYIKARDLSNMREEMNNDISVRILLGGKKQGYSGAYPGLLEEAVLAIKDEKPIYLIGAFGGITQEIIKCVIGDSSYELSKDYQLQDDDYSSFYHYYNQMALKDCIKPINYEGITNFLKKKGIKGLNNRLTENENKILFESDNTIQIISLILKGLSNK